MACLVCTLPSVVEKLDLGRHPVASQFLPPSAPAPPRFRIALGRCSDCGTVQLMPPVPYDALVAPVLIRPKEPEDHLDNVVDRLLALPDFGRCRVAAGLTYNDDGLLERLDRAGVASTWRVDMAADLGITGATANIESVQHRIDPATMRAIAVRRGRVDILVMRHVIEHAEDPPRVMAGIAELVEPGGIVVLEGPDCSTSLRLGDYCMAWEEHSLYLTPATLHGMACLGGFGPTRLDVYPRPFENSLVLIARKTGDPALPRPGGSAREATTLFEDYARRYEPTKRALRARLTSIRRAGASIALFGAGHLACAFANFLDVADLIDFVADDTPEKQGCLLPGTGLAILPTSMLRDSEVGLCLLAVSVGSEERVMARIGTSAGRDIACRSILRSSPRSIFADTRT